MYLDPLYVAPSLDDLSYGEDPIIRSQGNPEKGTTFRGLGRVLGISGDLSGVLGSAEGTTLEDPC